jgi:lipoyl-dependent peroxiredoxin
MAERKADARWTGDLKGGEGTMRLGSGAYEGQHSFSSRFEEGDGTNPEELIAAAHAGCFSMALADELSEAGHTVESVETTATVSLGQQDGEPAITGIELSTKVSASGVEEEEEFQKIADGAKQGCPVSKALAATEITLDAELTSG